MGPPRWESIWRANRAPEPAAVYVVDVARLTHLHGYASFLGIKDSLLRDMLEEGSKATGHVEKLAEEVQVPLEKIIPLRGT